MNLLILLLALFAECSVMSAPAQLGAQSRSGDESSDDNITVSVTIDGKDSEVYVPYVQDDSARWNDALVPVVFGCEADYDFTDDDIVYIYNQGFGELYELINGSYVNVRAGTYRCSEISNRSFFLHGHSISANINDGSVTIACVHKAAIASVKYTVCSVRFVTPAGDPCVAPDKSGDGQNEFTYSDSKVGILTINLKARMFPVGVATSMSNSLYFEVDDIGNSVKRWGFRNPNGRVSVSNNLLMATVTFRGLPRRNSDFGKKTTRVTYNGKTFGENDYEVFFPKYAVNHPNGQRNSPNWYYYWMQTSAKINYTNVSYYNEYRSGYDIISKRVYIGFGAAEENILSWDLADGIDSFAWTCAHEDKHRRQAANFWASAYDASLDRDGDWIPDQLESQYMPQRPYDSTKKATYNDSIGYGEDPIPDIEDICMRCQSAPYEIDSLWQNGSADAEDWSNPGKQSYDKE